MIYYYEFRSILNIFLTFFFWSSLIMVFLILKYYAKRLIRSKAWVSWKNLKNTELSKNQNVKNAVHRICRKKIVLIFCDSTKKLKFVSVWTKWEQQIGRFRYYQDPTLFLINRETTYTEDGSVYQVNNFISNLQPTWNFDTDMKNIHM